MNTKTRSTFIFALIFFITAMVLFVGALWQVSVVRAKLVEEAALVAQNDALEQAYLQLTRTLEVSADDRKAIDQLFLTEDRTIDFLAELETIAVSFGIDMQTTGLDLKPVPGEQLEELNVRLAMEGSETQIMRFLKLLEVLPYHSRIEGVTVTERSGASWEGAVHIVITSLPQ